MTAGTNTINGHLDDLFAVISVSGDDAMDFLHAQLTCDVRQLSAETAMVGAYLSPKGRVLALVTVIDAGDGSVLLLTHPSLVSSLANRLKMFVLRSRVNIEPADDLHVSGSLSPAAPPGEISLASLPVTRDDAGTWIAWPGGGTLGISDSTVGAPPIADNWVTRDCLLGLPHVTETTTDRHVAQMLNLDRLGVINFRKGCFPGQEIVARAHYRGRVKRRLHRYFSPVTLPPAARLEDDSGKAAGEVLHCGPIVMDAAAYPLLAIVRDELSSETLSAPEHNNAALRPLASEEPNVV